MRPILIVAFSVVRKSHSSAERVLKRWRREYKTYAICRQVRLCNVSDPNETNLLRSGAIKCRTRYL